MYCVDIEMIPINITKLKCQSHMIQLIIESIIPDQKLLFLCGSFIKTAEKPVFKTKSYPN